MTHTELTDISRSYRLTVKQLGPDRYKLSRDRRHAIHLLFLGPAMYYGTYGVPGFTHPKNGRYVPPVFYTGQCYGLLFDDIHEPMQAAAAGELSEGNREVPSITSSYRRMYTKHLHHEQGGKCHYCKRRIASKNATCDHKQPLSRGGLDVPGNWVMACYHCNSAKGAMTEEEYLEDAPGGS